MSGQGCAWMLGVAGATRYPTDLIGGASATNTSSLMNKNVTGARIGQVLGILVLVPDAAGTVSICLHNGTAVPGLTFPATVAGQMHDFFSPENGILFNRVENTNGSNFGLTCAAGVTALMFWRRLS